jgi:hypothetical protein
MKFRIWKQKLIVIIAFFTTMVLSVPAQAQVHFTKEEQDYIKNSGNIKAVSMDGVAPLQYCDSKGHIKGISINGLDYISDMTGLTFTYHLYNTIEDVKNSGADIAFGVIENNQFENVPLSIPYLKTESILYINSSVNPNELDDRRYAAIEGTILPEGIKEENTVYFNTREDCLQGDNVLVNISKALTKAFRKTDIVGRIGGDEFCVYMSNIPSSEFVVSKCRQFQVLIEKLNRDINVTVSIGISLLEDDKSYDDLFQKADKALYNAKKKGGNQIQFYK